MTYGHERDGIDDPIPEAAKQKPLFLPLRKVYFEAFKNGEKLIEYRKLGKRWNPTRIRPGRAVTLSCGYSGERLEGRIRMIWMDDDPELLPGFTECYGTEKATAFCMRIILMKDRTTRAFKPEYACVFNHTKKGEK